MRLHQYVTPLAFVLFASFSATAQGDNGKKSTITFTLEHIECDLKFKPAQPKNAPLQAFTDILPQGENAVGLVTANGKINFAIRSNPKWKSFVFQGDSACVLGSDSGAPNTSSISHHKLYFGGWPFWNQEKLVFKSSDGNQNNLRASHTGLCAGVSLGYQIGSHFFVGGDGCLYASLDSTKNDGVPGSYNYSASGGGGGLLIKPSLYYELSDSIDSGLTLPLLLRYQAFNTVDVGGGVTGKVDSPALRPILGLGASFRWSTKSWRFPLDFAILFPSTLFISVGASFVL